MFYIEPDILLSNYFLYNSGSINWGDLRRIGYKIENSFPKKDVYVDISTPSVFSFIETHPSYFYWGSGGGWGGGIFKQDKNKVFFSEEYINKYFNKYIPKSILKVLLKVVKEYKK
ncbi:MAG: hypothetical protein WC942_09590 [Clostridia bacterium]|jgi:hypothetical protein